MIPSQQKLEIIRMGSEDHKITCFVQFWWKARSLDGSIKLKNNFFIIFKLESINLHQNSTNHAKSIVNAKDNVCTTGKTDKIIY